MKIVYTSIQKIANLFRKKRSQQNLRLLAKQKLNTVQLQGRLHATTLQKQLAHLYSQEEESLFI